MTHRLSQVLEQSHHWCAVCVCGHVATAPTKDSVVKRHELHVEIQQVRRVLEDAKTGKPHLKVVK